MPGAGGDPFEAFRRAQQRPRRRGRGAATAAVARPGPDVTVEDFDPSEFGGAATSATSSNNSSAAAAAARRRRGAAPAPRGAAPGRARAAARRGRRTPRHAHLRPSRPRHDASAADQPRRPARDDRREDPRRRASDGSRVRIKGKGQQSPSGEPGDLFIITHVQPHPYFRREGLDILLDLPISLYEALLGTKVTVPTLDGPVTLTIPPGTSSGAKLRIKGRGVVRGDEKGDQYVVDKIIVPKELDDEDKAAVQKLQSKHPIERAGGREVVSAAARRQRASRAFRRPLISGVSLPRSSSFIVINSGFAPRFSSSRTMPA